MIGSICDAGAEVASLPGQYGGAGYTWDGSNQLHIDEDEVGILMDDTCLQKKFVNFRVNKNGLLRLQICRY